MNSKIFLAMILLYWLLISASPKPTNKDPAKPKKAFLDALAPRKNIAKKYVSKAKRRKYRRGTYLKINGRRAEAGEAVTIDLRKPETYESAGEKEDEAYVIHPLLVAYEEPEEIKAVYDPLYSKEINEVVLWPGYTESYEAYYIPYEFSPDSTFSVADKQLIESVMLEFERHTCIRFRPKWHPTQHYVSLSNTPGQGCCSMPGMTVGDGYQIFNLETPGCMDENTIAHELMHAAGVHHTHQRADRDKHVTVHWDYVDPEYTSEYIRFRNYIPNVPYDKNSVMHYLSFYFANPKLNGLAMVDVNGKQLHSKQKLQLGDWHQLNVLYDCTNYLPYTKTYFDNWNRN